MWQMTFKPQVGLTAVLFWREDRKIDIKFDGIFYDFNSCKVKNITNWPKIVINCKKILKTNGEWVVGPPGVLFQQ